MNKEYDVKMENDATFVAEILARLSDRAFLGIVVGMAGWWVSVLGRVGSSVLNIIQKPEKKSVTTDRTKERITLRFCIRTSSFVKHAVISPFLFLFFH